MKRFGIAICAGILLVSTCGLSSAGEVVDQSGNRVWKAGIDGPEIEWDKDGTLKRISSKYSQPVQFPDRRGIRKAQIIAEERAKAQIIRFLKQTSTDARLVAEVENDVEKASRERTSSGETWSKDSTRTMVETLTTVTGSFASGDLSGVMILEKGYDEAAEEAWVVVGISKNSQKAVKGLNGMLEETEGFDPNSNVDQDGCKSASSKSCPGNGTQPSEVETLNNPDW